MIKAILVAITLFASTTSYSNKQISEEDLVISEYKPSDQAQFKKFFSIDEFFENGKTVYKITAYTDTILEQMEEWADESGLLTGNTNYELTKKAKNLFVDYGNWKWNQMEIKVKDKEKLSSVPLMHYVDGIWSSDSPTIKLIPAGNVEKIYFNFDNFKFSNLRFYDRNKITISKDWGLVFVNDDIDDEWKSFDLFRPVDVKKDDSDYEKAFSSFTNKEENYYKAQLAPHSNKLTVIYANQNSKKANFRKGYNVIVENKNKPLKLPINKNFLLIPVMLLIFPYLYFLLKRLLKR